MGLKATSTGMMSRNSSLAKGSCARGHLLGPRWPQPWGATQPPLQSHSFVTTLLGNASFNARQRTARRLALDSQSWEQPLGTWEECDPPQTRLSWKVLACPHRSPGLSLPVPCPVCGFETEGEGSRQARVQGGPLVARNWVLMVKVTPTCLHMSFP